MSALLGIFIVIAAIIGGYLLEHGNLLVLWQPAEFVIIFGAAVGTIFVANPMRVVKEIFKGAADAFKKEPFTKAEYSEALRMLYELFTAAKRVSDAEMEKEVDHPEEGPVLSKYPGFLKNGHAKHFLCDTLRTLITGNIAPHDLDQLMETDIEIQHNSATKPVTALRTMAESLPGLGIVAAVLGVVITMGALGGPPEEIGHKVAAALIGTFLGILLCYGFVGPIADNLTSRHEAEQQYLEFLRTGILGYARGLAPIVAVELARRSIPVHLRPGFEECEGALRGEPKPEEAKAA